MRKLRAFLIRFGSTFNQGRLDRELAEEIESHLQLHIDDKLRAGMSQEEARRQAMLALGGIEPVKEACRDRSGLPIVETTLQDFRYALRALRRSPSFTAAAI